MDSTTEAAARTGRWAWAILAVPVLIGGAFVVASLGEDGDDSSPAVEASDTTTTMPTTTTTVPLYPHVSTFNLKNPIEGYTASAVVRRGDLTKAETVPNLPSACPINRQTDAVVPFELELVNTTTDFAAKPAISLTPGAPPSFWYHAPFLRLRAVVTYSGGPQCQEFAQVGGDTFGLAPIEPLRTGETIKASGWFLIGGYYSPAAPAGLREKLRDVVLTVGGGTGSRFGVTAATNALRTSGAQAWAVPLDPASDGGCTVKGDCGPGFVVP